MIFWNVAGLKKKDRDFWKYIKEFDFISLCETWVEEKDWNKLKGYLPNTHMWECRYAKRDNKKVRAKGGFIIGNKKGGGVENGEMIEKCGEGWTITRMKEGKNRKDLIIVSVYNCSKIIKIIPVKNSHKQISALFDVIKILEFKINGRRETSRDLYLSRKT